MAPAGAGVPGGGPRRGPAAHFGRGRITDRRAGSAGLPPGTASIHTRLGTGCQVPSYASAIPARPCRDHGQHLTGQSRWAPSTCGPEQSIVTASAVVPGPGRRQGRLCPRGRVKARAGAVHAEARMPVPVAGGGPRLGGRRGGAVEDVFPPADRRLVIPQATECGAVTRPAFRLRRQPTCPALESPTVHAWVRAEDP